MQAAALAEVRSVAKHSGSVDVVDLRAATDRWIAHRTSALCIERMARFAAERLDACTRADRANKNADEARR